MDRFAQFAVAASLQALEQAGLKGKSELMSEVGVVIGSGIGGLGTLCKQLDIFKDRGPSRVSPFLIPMMMADSASGQVSILLGAKGPNFCTTSACSSSSDAVGEAYEIVKRGDSQAMITGGSEAAITPIAVAGFRAAGALSDRNHQPQEASRPFDADRDGFVIGEGAAIMVLESLPFALRRGANILGEIIGYGASSDAFHITQPDEDGEGGAKAMRLALSKAGIKPSEIDYINAHGTSTRLNDKIETLCIKKVFGNDAYRIPISSTKSMLGHLLGTAGAIEAMITLLTIRHGVIPPTINLTHPDPECDLDYVPNKARPAKVRTALTNSLGFGGHNSVLIFREYTEDR
jgi:3-oxoacyl-[acyl-carrier-protein] synthase II